MTNLKSLGGVAAIAVLLASAPAQAVTVSNLDDQPHQVVFEVTSNNKLIRDVKPGESLQQMQPRGKVYLLGAENPIHVNADDRLVIWPDGKLQIQMRRHTYGEAGN